jgi:hypothetical protein
VLGALALLVASAAIAGASRGAQDKDGAGVTFSKQATSKEVGLPVYPGAKPHKDEKEDSAGEDCGILQEGAGEVRHGIELFGAIAKAERERFEQARVRG